ncbi:hypothetical protein GCM10010156_55680 [Planobispora rosea]|uniref:Uncharacterized protein n=1 Tax=Planobispora rosea TaxID=35762 RepID=A0A8J3WFL3_PLARO|nr:hypothetical protein [Planobispora rosea]GGS90169.1 hypothetical protein GCM10010156_55680 [Planobispora rosea]GIH86942.1 hypothetical protein Pro02_53500 [Planobispora rosea]
MPSPVLRWGRLWTDMVVLCGRVVRPAVGAGLWWVQAFGLRGRAGLLARSLRRPDNPPAPHSS